MAKPYTADGSSQKTSMQWTRVTSCMLRTNDGCVRSSDNLSRKAGWIPAALNFSSPAPEDHGTSDIIFPCPSGPWHFSYYISLPQWTMAR